MKISTDDIQAIKAIVEDDANGHKAAARVRHLAVRNMADVERREVAWLWRGWLARGSLAVLTGHPDVGKSWLMLALTAAITLGANLFGDPTQRPPRKVLWFTAEDPLEYVVGPRLDSVGADSRMVDVVTAVNDPAKPEGFFSLVSDLDLLDKQLANGEYALVVMDPINSYMGATLDTHRDAAVRSVLGPLAALAEKRDVAIVGIIHPTKGAQGLPLYRIQGAVANSAAARTALLVGRDEENDGEHSFKRHVTLLKNNLIPDEDKPPSLCYELTLEHGFQWVGESSATASELLNGPATDDETRDAKGARDEAKEFLNHELTNGEVLAVDVRALARKEGIADRTLDRAKRDLGIVSRREGFGKDSRVFWSLLELPIERHDSHRTPTSPNPETRRSMENVADYVAPATRVRLVEERPGEWRAEVPDGTLDQLRPCCRDLWAGRQILLDHVALHHLEVIP